MSVIFDIKANACRNNRGKIVGFDFPDMTTAKANCTRSQVYPPLAAP